MMLQATFPEMLTCLLRKALEHVWDLVILKYNNTNQSAFLNFLTSPVYAMTISIIRHQHDQCKDKQIRVLQKHKQVVHLPSLDWNINLVKCNGRPSYHTRLISVYCVLLTYLHLRVKKKLDNKTGAWGKAKQYWKEHYKIKMWVYCETC